MNARAWVDAARSDAEVTDAARVGEGDGGAGGDAGQETADGALDGASDESPG